MTRYQQQLDWIARQQSVMIDLVEAFSNINSHTENLLGLTSMLEALKSAFGILGGHIEEIPLPPRMKIDSKGQQTEVPTGRALKISKHPNAPNKVFLSGHMDTVYPITSPFQKAWREDGKLRGPGTADMKGGLVVMLKAVEALESSPFAGNVGWEILINPDEEVGSPSSESLFIEAAQRNHIGLVFEPAYPDGSLVSDRKGSANFTVVIKGRSAHAGRDFFSGRSAVSALARLIVSMEELIDEEKGITLNVGHVEGGIAANIVPDLAVGRINIRVANDLDKVTEKLRKIVEKQQEGIAISLYNTAAREPKPFHNKNKALFRLIKECGTCLNMDLKTKPSGGVCDGNILSAAGLPTIDTLGVVGGNIHTPEEYMLIDSLTERSSLTALFLLKIASGEMDITKLKKE